MSLNSQIIIPTVEWNGTTYTTYTEHNSERQHKNRSHMLCATT